jgi:hypothetical protein
MTDAVNQSARIVRMVTQRLSLRPPQAASLEILDDVLNCFDINKLGDTRTILHRSASPRGGEGQAVGDGERQATRAERVEWPPREKVNCDPSLQDRRTDG